MHDFCVKKRSPRVNEVKKRYIDGDIDIEVEVHNIDKSIKKNDAYMIYIWDNVFKPIVVIIIVRRSHVDGSTADTYMSFERIRIFLGLKIYIAMHILI